MDTLQKNDKWVRFSGKVGSGRAAIGADELQFGSAFFDIGTEAYPDRA